MIGEPALADVHAAIVRDNERIRRLFLLTFATLGPAEPGDTAGSPPIEPGDLDRWRAGAQVFAVPVDSEERYPLFQFAGGRPRPVVAQILAILPQDMTPWQVAFWFVSSSSWLGGPAPLSIIDTDPESVVGAAESERDQILG